ncbi:MAG: cyclic nucleotide-binding domain-containing protein [Xanthomonadaceae bacterium]|nr:cyclic nucleotide-binding domain-containing protein [Xanthomonadaceae bacterium]
MGVRAPQPAPQTAPPASVGPKTLVLKKGQLVFQEGDTSKAMYLVKKGSIRIFKKKGTNITEIGTVNVGEVLGELAFLDGLPRSASCEALNDAELVEISGAAFTQTLSSIPDWLKAMLKTIVGRLRAASNKIRQLEAAQQSFDYSKDSLQLGYTFINSTEAAKLATCVLLVALRKSNAGQKNTPLELEMFNKIANQVHGLASSKTQAFIDTLIQAGMITQEGEGSAAKFSLNDLDVLEKYIMQVNESNQQEPVKRKIFSVRGFTIMSVIGKYLSKFKTDSAQTKVKINLFQIQTAEKEATGKAPFRNDEYEELIRHEYVGAINFQAEGEIMSEIDTTHFIMQYKIQRLIKALDALNDSKRK